MNRGGETGNQLMFFTFLFMLVMIGAGIVAGVLIFFGNEYDTRHIDADILNYKIRKCIIEKDFEFSNNGFFETCLLNEKTMTDSEIIVKICIDSSDCLTEKDSLLIFGSNFQACGFEGVKENKAFPRCKMNSFVKEGKKYDVITGSNQKVRRLNYG